MAAEDVKPPAAQKLEKNFSKIVLTLENVLIQAEKVETTPSSEDGLDAETEMDLRILGTELIQIAGMLLKLPQTAMATGCVLFQRFYYSKSFVRHAMEIVAIGCTNLAAKIEEAPRRIRDVINVFHHIKQVRSGRTISPLVLNQDYISLKNNVIKAERRVLKELGFCVHVKHPHKMIIMYLEILNCKSNKQLAQKSWNYMNDSLRTNVFVRYSPETIACACVYLAARQLEIPLPNRPHWFLIFDATEEDVREIARTVLSLYSRPKASIERLEAVVEEAKQRQMAAKQKAKEPIAASQTEIGAGFSPASNSRPATPSKKPAVGGPASASGNAATGTGAAPSSSPQGALGRALLRLKKEKEEEEDSAPSENQENHRLHSRHRGARKERGRDRAGRKPRRPDSRSSDSSSRSTPPRKQPHQRSSADSRGTPTSPLPPVAKVAPPPSPKLPRSYSSPRLSRSPSNNAVGSAGPMARSDSPSPSRSPSPKRKRNASPSTKTKRDGGGHHRSRTGGDSYILIDDDDDEFGKSKDHRSRSRTAPVKHRKDKDGLGPRNTDLSADGVGGFFRGPGGGGLIRPPPRSPSRSPIRMDDYSPTYKKKSSKKSYYKEKDRSYKTEERSSSSSKKKSHRNGHSKERERYGGRDGDYMGVGGAGPRDYYRDDFYVKHKR